MGLWGGSSRAILAARVSSGLGVGIESKRGSTCLGEHDKVAAEGSGLDAETMNEPVTASAPSRIVQLPSPATSATKDTPERDAKQRSTHPPRLAGPQ